MSDQKPSPLALLLSSRKAALGAFVAALIILFATGIEVAIVVATIRGRMTLEAAINASFGSLFVAASGAISLAWKIIDGITKEDVASKTAPAVINVADTSKE